MINGSNTEYVDAFTILDVYMISNTPTTLTILDSLIIMINSLHNPGKTTRIACGTMIYRIVSKLENPNERPAPSDLYQWNLNRLLITHKYMRLS